MLSLAGEPCCTFLLDAFKVNLQTSTTAVMALNQEVGFYMMERSDTHLVCMEHNSQFNLTTKLNIFPALHLCYFH